MDEKYYEERVLLILEGREGCDEEYSSISESKEHLNEAGLAEEEFRSGWVMWRENEQQQLHHKIKTLLKHVASNYWFGFQSLVQFWGVVKEEGRHHYLSTSHYPFSFDKHLIKGVSWYRKICMDRGAVEAEQLGGVGRAYRNKHPESTPDLRLYSTDEFPLRDEAARCGLRAYMALPLFDLHTHESYGVLELLSDFPFNLNHSILDRGLEIAGLKSTHKRKDTLDRNEQPDNEITEILALAIKAVPRLSLAQVWIPCKQCPSRSCTTLCCMEVTSSGPNLDDDDDMSNYLKACEFHNLQIDFTCFHQNMSDLSISQSPLAHYAKKARISHCFAFCLQNVNNSNYPFVIIQFFLQLNNREDACGDSSLHLLLRIIETKFKSFEVRMEQLPDKLIVQSRQPNIAIECESIDMLNVMKSYKENFSEPDFTTYLETSCSLPPFSEKVGDRGWVFCSLVGENLIDNDVQDNFLNVLSLPKYKIQQFMKKIVVKLRGEYWIIQFWTPKMVEDRYCLETIDQPYALSSLAKDLASFRKECTKHHYFVDDEAKEDELGPPGRVFRNEHPEFTPRLFLYSKKEFGMRNYAVHCHLQEYLALPVFDKQEHKCVGVLEFIGIEYDKWFAKDIEETLKVANLSTSCGMRPRVRAYHRPTKIAKALTEVESAFSLIGEIPQLYLAKVWVPYKKCDNMNSNVRYMKLALTTEYWWEESYTNQVHWISRVQSKKGMIGMVLESENKSCFCRNLSEFSIADQPLALVEREKRLDVCFAICLQSCHTGDLLYVLEFFLNPSINDLPSFFNFLLPIFKQELQSFKYSSGKHIGEELVVEVIEFHEANNLAFSELDQLDVFPIKFRRVQYGQTEHQQAVDESVHCISDARQTEQGNIIVAANRVKRNINLHLSLEDLKPHFGKKLNDVAEELGIGRSTIKRACREYGIDRWPGNEKQARNPSLFGRESARDPQQDMLWPGNEKQARNPSLFGRESARDPQQDMLLHQNVACAHTQHVTVQEEAEKVMIRVKYEEDTIKFELCLSLGVSKLFEEVVSRLNLKMGSFKLKYVDEENEEISIACDDDLQLCHRSQTKTDKTCVRMFVQLNSK